jgi:transcriptional regulator with XRE-family HTH domain
VARQSMELIAHPVLLRRRMTQQGFTNRSLAKSAGCGVATIGRLVSGAATRTSRRIAEAIEKELREEPGKLFAVPEVIHEPGNSTDRGPVDELGHHPVGAEPDAA